MQAPTHSNRQAEAKKERILQIASEAGWKYAIAATILSGAATLAASYRFKNFQRFASPSIKTSIPTMIGLATWSYAYESTTVDAMQRPYKYGISEEGDGPLPKISHLGIHKQLVNYFYDHPFQLVAGLGFPLASGILYSQRQNTHLTLSQKIMHSRVFAQAGVLTILLSTMAFREYMDRNGRFLDSEEEEEMERLRVQNNNGAE
jgi:hypothetical protein